ncbi:PREDICTED: uncharacterized protein LOC108757419 [Trachymyrmex cornetzi]|uniref:uncharacterized protein LOC108757419 n=1 Tax=Trachymyrmex cornetzi TaxID=471704 RepID=UPI00084EECC7|nr:PREDICTED: uncharacterized protein LOC108757419 [Trachymyrmex cornetzi]
MNPKTKVALALAVQLFEGDTFDDDLLTIACSKSGAALGHLCGEEWIQYYLDFDFHQLFRIRKDTFKELVKVIAPRYVPKMQRGDTPAVTVEKATLMTLWYLAGQSSMESLGDRFVWPKDHECAVVRQQFYDKAGYPGVIGAIDDCHIDILAPADDQDSYTNRKMNHSIILQGSSL